MAYPDHFFFRMVFIRRLKPKGCCTLPYCPELEIPHPGKAVETLDVDALERLDQGACPEKVILFGRSPLGFIF